MTLQDFLKHLRELRSLPAEDRLQWGQSMERDLKRRWDWWLPAIRSALSGGRAGVPPIAPLVAFANFDIIPAGKGDRVRQMVSVVVLTRGDRKPFGAKVLRLRHLDRLIELVLKALDPIQDPYLYVVRMRDATFGGASAQSARRRQVATRRHSVTERRVGLTTYNYVIRCRKRFAGRKRAASTVPADAAWIPWTGSSSLFDLVLRSLTTADISEFGPEIDRRRATSRPRLRKSPGQRHDK